MSDPVLVRFAIVPDPCLERFGVHVRSDYVERVWASVLGPSSILCLRAAVALVEEAGEAVTVDLSEFARGIGLGPGVGSTSSVRRTLERLERFHLASALADGHAVRAWLAPLSYRLLARAPQSAREFHEHYAAERSQRAEAS